MNIKKLTLFIGMALILLNGQNSAMALNLADYDGTGDPEAFSVTITHVGASVLDSSVYTPTSHGDYGETYDLVAASGVAQFFVKFNYTGLTTFKDTFNTTGSKDAATATAGEILIFSDGEVLTSGSGAPDEGFSWSYATGDHSLSIVYMGMEEDGTFKYASDSITVRVRTTDSFGPYVVTDFPLDYQVVDEADPSTPITDQSNIYWSDYWYGFFYKNVTFSDVPQDLDFAYGPEDTAFDGKLWEDVTYSNITMSGTVNTVGYIDSAVEYPYPGYPNTTSHETTIGRSFILDAYGPRLVSDVLDVAEDEVPMVGIRNSIGNDLVYTFVGLASVADAGVLYWGDIENLGIGDFSFDFFTSVSGGYMAIPNVTFEFDSPGFGLLSTVSGIFAIAFVAFVIPRRFRKEE